MAPYDMYDIFKGRADPGRSERMHVVPPQNGPKAAPAGEYWVAYHPDYIKYDEKHANGDSLVRLRPALQENDDVHWDENGDLLFVKPTEYAKRWGLHQNAPRGRSRCSLTRSDTRTFESDGLQQPVTGKWLAEYFENKAARDNMDLREWLEENIPRAALSEDDKVYLGWLEDILRDEVWQGMLFHDFTMDELHEGDIFTMRDDVPKCDIQGLIHPMLARENWLAPVVDADFGRSPEEPRWFYKVDGKEGEYDPVNNDEVWNTLKPALLLASRVLEGRPEYLNAILRIWDHKVMPQGRDNRPQKRGNLKTFDTVPADPNDPALLQTTQFLRPIGDKYVAGMWEAITSRLRLHIHGDSPACAMTVVNGIRATNDPNTEPRVFICLNPIIVFPLLVPGYSQSEKTMASYFVANAILHEIAHAFGQLSMLSLYRPDMLPQTVAPDEDAAKFAAAAREYRNLPQPVEPYFRDEPVSELGFSFQNWLFGNVKSALTINDHRTPVHGLSKQTIALRAERFPFFKVLEAGMRGLGNSRYSGPMLDEPVYDAEGVYVNAPVHDVAPFFRQDFWMSAVRLYGVKAMKAVATDHMLKATGSMLENTSTFGLQFFEGIGHARDRITAVMDLLYIYGFSVARNYLNALMAERIQLSMAIRRWDSQKKYFKARGSRAKRDILKLFTIGVEARLYRGLQRLRGKNAPENEVQEFITENHEKWKRFVSALPEGRPPKGSEALVGLGPDAFVLVGEVVVRQSGCQRYLASLPDVFAFFTSELQQMEQAVFETYMLDEREMQHMLERFRDPWSRGLDILTSLARVCIGGMSFFQGEHPDVGTWITRFLEVVNQYTILKRYVTADQRKLNPVTWRRMFLSIGKGNAGRKTQSKNWANLVRDELANMPQNLRVAFEGAVGTVMAYSGTPPHLEAKTIREQFGGTAASPGAPGVFMDLVSEMELDPAQFTAENLMLLMEEPGFNPADAAALRTIVNEAREQVARRRETRDEIQRLQDELGVMQSGLENDNAAYQAQEAVRHARERREVLEGQIAGLQRLQAQHDQLQNYDAIHDELNQLQALLEELLEEVFLRELHAERVREDPAVAEERAFQQRLIEGEIVNLRDIERRHEEQVRARVLEEQRERGAQASPSDLLPMTFQMSFPPGVEDMLPRDLNKRKRDESDEGGPGGKRFRTEALKTLIEDPPFIGGPTRIEGRPLPFTRCEQLAMPFGGLPEVRYEVEPLKVRGEAAINVVERLADGVERWGEMGVRTRYEIPRGAVEALGEVAESMGLGLPKEMEWE